MLSRAAHSLYWMSRYLERAEHTARLLNVNLRQMLDQTPEAAGQRWDSLLGSLNLPPAAESGRDPYSIAQSLTFDRTNAASIVSCIALARDNARQVREGISSEMWEQLNRLFLAVTWANREEVVQAEPYEFCQTVKEGAHLFQGITDATMSHGEGWHFIQVGRYLERALATATLLDVQLSPFFSAEHEATPIADDTTQWVGLLKSCTAFEAYCKVYTARMQPERILDFLLLNAEFPRSLRFVARAIQADLQAIARATGNRGGRAERLAGRLCAALDYAQVEEVVADGVHTALRDIQGLCKGIHTALYQTYILQQDVAGKRRWVEEDPAPGQEDGAARSGSQVEEPTHRFMQEPQ